MPYLYEETVQLDIELPLKPKDDQLKNVIQSIFSLKESIDVSIVQLTAGHTNRLYLISFIDIQVLVRINGEKTENLIDREKELLIFSQLSQYSIAPPIYGIFNNGNCYGFTKGVSFTVDNLKDIDKYPLVAKKMAKFHQVDMPFLSKSPHLFITIKQWLNELNDMKLTSFKSKEDIINEISWIKKLMKGYTWSISFCHNDLLPANIIFSDNGEVEFIDYEYGNYNYTLFDIGNHFNEMMGPDLNIKNFPDESLQMKWLEYYYNSIIPDKKEKILNQIKIMVLASNIYWGIWSLVQYQNQDKEIFDYKSYAKRKYKAYFSLKSKWFSK